MQGPCFTETNYLSEDFGQGIETTCEMRMACGNTVMLFLKVNGSSVEKDDVNIGFKLTVNDQLCYEDNCNDKVWTPWKSSTQALTQSFCLFMTLAILFQLT